MFEYIKTRYNVPAEVGREIIFEGKRKGIIAYDLGSYLGVNFYDKKPNAIEPLHPTFKVEYLDTFAKIRPITKSQQRYLDYLEADSDLSFINWIKCLQKHKSFV